MDDYEMFLKIRATIFQILDSFVFSVETDWSVARKPFASFKLLKIYGCQNLTRACLYSTNFDGLFIQ